MKIIYIFNSQYVSFLVISETVGATIVMFIELGIDFLYFFKEVIPLVIVIFGTLMYNEIIIINLFGLETKTKKYLTLEQDLEVNEQIGILDKDDYNLYKEDEDV
jgi:hypothetical protein